MVIALELAQHNNLLSIIYSHHQIRREWLPAPASHF
jgi:hypothetical protein